MLTIPPLLTAYAKWPGGPIIPCWEEIRISRPRASPSGSCSSIAATAARAQRKTPRRLTAMIASQSSSEVSSSGFECAPAIAALATNTSSRPRLRARATIRSTSATSDTSASRCSPRSPSSSAVEGPPSRGSGERSATITWAPSSAKRRAIARPIPELAPVTTATLPSRRTGIPYAASVRIAVIGAGWIAADHVGRIGRTAGLELAAVADLDPERAAMLAGERPVYGDWREMLERESPDAVLIATPPLTHRKIAVDVLDRGIHLYLEKPIARGLEDARAIVDAAERSSAVCAIGYQWRGVDALATLREAIAGQQVGLVIGIGTGPTQSRPWFLDRAQGGGNVLERASHIIDIERAVGGEVVEVQGAASRVALAQSADV